MHLPANYPDAPSGTELDALPARQRDAWITAELIGVINNRDRQILVSLLERKDRHYVVPLVTEQAQA